MFFSLTPSDAHLSLGIRKRRSKCVLLPLPCREPDSSVSLPSVTCSQGPFWWAEFPWSAQHLAPHAGRPRCVRMLISYEPALCAEATAFPGNGVTCSPVQTAPPIPFAGSGTSSLFTAHKVLHNWLLNSSPPWFPSRLSMCPVHTDLGTPVLSLYLLHSAHKLQHTSHANTSP